VDPLTGLQAARFTLYLHFPYCLSKCPYCDFASTVARQVPEARYADAVLRELSLRLSDQPALAGRALDAVFLGGGTPSLWDPAHVGRVLSGIRDVFPLAEGAEITLEANPGAADAARFEGFRAAGLNRLSIGVQSFDPDTLKFLGRAHDDRAAVAAYRAARQAGFDNVSLDFIYGVPGQTVAMAAADAARAADLGSEHLSAYALTLDKESLAEEVPLARQLARGEVALPPDEEVLAMQRAVRDAYRGAGLDRYEVSNYARSGYHSRHNAAYWTGGDYLALGSGATGYLAEGPAAGVRWQNHRSAEQYLRSVEAGILPLASREPLGADALFGERVAMGLRLASGLELEAACRAFGVPFEPKRQRAQALVERGLLALQDGRYRPTDEGFDLHSAVAAWLM
jgi:putative oxygen-independent coproporphyrinogen III oxidase